MSDFQSFVFGDPEACVIHMDDAPEAAKILITASPVDIQVMALIFDTVMNGNTPTEIECKSATIMHNWFERAWFAFTDEERERGGHLGG